jgi:hypothetical protein
MRPRTFLAAVLALLLALAIAPAAVAEEDPDVFGTVTDAATGEPIAGATVTLFIAPPPQPVESTTTDEDGFYAFFDVEAAAFVGASAEGYEPGDTEFDYDGTEPVEANIELLSTAGDPAVAGTITAAATGAPLGTTSDEAPAGVFLVYDDVGWFGGFDTFFWADEDGVFEGYAVEVGRAFWLVPDVAGYVPTPAGPYIWDGEQTVWVDFALDVWFPDVPTGHTHFMNIWHIAAAGVTTGFVDGTFRPADPVIRGQMASFLDRALDLPAGQATFSDVPADHTHAAGIGAVAAAEITLGFPDGTFRPGLPVTRGQMASFLDRALDLPAGQATFSDVPAGHTHAAGIGAVAAAEITLGFPDGTFRPEDPVARGQMASFLTRALQGHEQAALSVYGTISDAETGEPIAGAEVHYDGGVVSTDADGAYEIFGLAPGDHVLEAKASGYMPNAGHFVYEGTPIAVDVALTPMTGPANVTGTVTDADTGEPIEEAHVSLWWEDGDGRWNSVPTDADGVYGLWGVDLDREFRLRVIGPSHLADFPGWDADEVYVTDVYSYDGTTQLVIDIELDAP